MALFVIVIMVVPLVVFSWAAYLNGSRSSKRALEKAGAEIAGRVAAVVVDEALDHGHDHDFDWD